jgi:hypothetical protein
VNEINGERDRNGKRERRLMDREKERRREMWR